MQLFVHADIKVNQYQWGDPWSRLVVIIQDMLSLVWYQYITRTYVNLLPIAWYPVDIWANVLVIHRKMIFMRCYIGFGVTVIIYQYFASHRCIWCTYLVESECAISRLCTPRGVHAWFEFIFWMNLAFRLFGEKHPIVALNTNHLCILCNAIPMLDAVKNINIMVANMDPWCLGRGMD